jgi:apolipoprotein D and lipocalin family protein
MIWSRLALQLLVPVLAVVVVGFSRSGAQDKSPPETVAFVDLESYIGLWYEIARIPNGFQDQCARNVTAEYTLRDDGRIDVINCCFKEDGSVDEANGLARVEDKESNAHLKVSFFSILGWRPVWADYLVIGLGDEYDYALVGSPDRKYGWILAREPELAIGKLEQLHQQLKDKGYDISRFVPTVQTWKTAE